LDRIQAIHFFIQKLKPEAQIGRTAPETVDEAINYYITEIFGNDIKEYQENRVVSARLQPFEIRAVLSTPITDQNEVYTLPTGIQRLTGFGALITSNGVAHSLEVEMKEIPETQFNRVYNSGLIVPETNYPICVVRGTTISVAPKNGILWPVIYYLRAPNPVRWGYTNENNGLDQTYAKTGGTNGASVDPEYPEYMDFSILRGALKYLGVSLRDDVLMSTMDQFEKTK
jgi:hypothetical protein